MNPLREKYDSFTDEQLIDIIVHKEDYRVDAIKIAETLIKERNIESNYITETTNHLELKKEENTITKNEPLSTFSKIALALFPFIGFIGWGLIQGKLDNGGFERKKQDATKFMIIGFITWMVLLYIIIAL